MSFRHQLLPAIVPWVLEERNWPRATHWLDPSAPEVYHPRALVSYHYWRDEKMLWAKGADVVFGDSGGYSVITKGAEIDPEDVIQWQIQRCTRGVMLDIPPYRQSDSIQFSGSAREHWEESMERTLSNVKRALPYYKDHKTEWGGTMPRPFYWWGVIQGESWDQLKDWHTRVSELYPFEAPLEGWALAPKPSNVLFPNVRHLRYAHENGLRRVHLLQVTSPHTLGVVFGLANLSGNFDLISYDSASAVRNAVNRGAVILDGYRFNYVKQKGNTGEVDELMQRCACQSCVWHRELDYSDWDEAYYNAYYAHAIALHNHLTMVEGFDNLHAAAKEDPEGVIRACTDKYYGAVMREWERSHSYATQQKKRTSIYDFIKK